MVTCPSTIGQVSQLCKSGSWQGPDFSDCGDSQLARINSQVNDTQAATDVIESLQKAKQVVQNLDRLNARDYAVISSLIETSFSASKASATDLLENFTLISTKLLDTAVTRGPRDLLRCQQHDHSNCVSSLTKARVIVAEQALHLALQGASVTSVVSSFELFSGPLPSDVDTIGVQYSVNSSTVRLPRSITALNPKAISLIQYDEVVWGRLYKAPSNLSQIATPLLQVNLDVPVNGLKEGIVLGLHSSEPVPPGFELRCHWWREETLSWERSGCTSSYDGKSASLICQCNHLTTFAGLLSRKEPVIGSTVYTAINIISMSMHNRARL